jgi:hypothetical protein
MRFRLLAGLLVAAASAVPVFVPASALAVGPRTFDLDTMDSLTGGDLKGASVSSDGTVRAGWLLGEVPLSQDSQVLCALPLADGSVLVGTAHSGQVLKVEHDRASVFAETHELSVWSLAQDARGTIFAGTSADDSQRGTGPQTAKVYTVSQGRADVYATIPDARYVWALAFDRARTTLYAGVGPDSGRIVRVQQGAGSQVVFKSDDENVVSLAVADNGDVWAGSSPRGLLYRMPNPGTGPAGSAQVVYDFPGEKAGPIAFGKNGYVYVVNNEFTEPPEPPRRPGAPGQRAAGPTTGGPPPKPGKGTLWRFDPLLRPERMMHNDDFHYTALFVDPASGAPWVGSGAEGRVLTVDDAHRTTVVADTDQRQVVALGVSGGKPFAVSSDPAVFHQVIGVGGQDAVWTSKVLDAGLRAHFGHLGWQATGTIAFSTRTGDTATPDPTWSGWSNDVTQPAPITSPSGRYVQVRARFAADPNASFSEVTIPFLTVNTRPVVTSVTASQPAARDTHEGLVASGGPPAKHDSVVHVTWKVDNTDLDPLRYRLFYKREGETIWRDMLRSDEVVTETDYKWETAQLPEGKYRVRVEASDEQANPPEQTMTHALDTSLVLVDNTPPTLTVDLTARHLRARAVDGLGPIVRIDVSVDGRSDWRPLAAVDGLYDGPDEAADSDVSAIVPPGPHIVAVRAFDAAGNFALQNVEAR